MDDLILRFCVGCFVLLLLQGQKTSFLFLQPTITITDKMILSILSSHHILLLTLFLHLQNTVLLSSHLCFHLSLSENNHFFFTVFSFKTPFCKCSTLYTTKGIFIGCSQLAHTIQLLTRKIYIMDFRSQAYFL